MSALCGALAFNWPTLKCSRARVQVNIVTKRCQEPLCDKHPSIGYPGSRPRFCKEHKAADMVRHQRACLLASLFPHCAV